MTLFSLSSGPGRPSRVTVCEAAIESCRRDTLYIGFCCKVWH